MTYFQVQDCIVNTAPEVEAEASVVYEENQLKDFLESLGPDQMSTLILSGAFEKAFSLEPVGEVNQQRSFPRENSRRGFDYQEWKNRRSPKIR